jgi:hypothetical protein
VYLFFKIEFVKVSLSLSWILNLYIDILIDTLFFIDTIPFTVTIVRFFNRRVDMTQVITRIVTII